MLKPAIEELKLRANNGDGEACYQLYQEYKLGNNVSLDEAEALCWLEKAIDLEHPVAQLVMGISFLNIGMFQDAIDYLTLSCQNENTDAKNILGQILVGNVKEVPDSFLDINKGFELLTSSAFSGNVFAQLGLGRIYLDGLLTKKDRFAAEFWLDKAAKQNNVEAAVLLEESQMVLSLLN